MAVKLEDVARLAGVSKTTVSRVLNNRGYISDRTKKAVNDAVAELHYLPNAVARQLFKKETKIVGLIFPTIDNPFFSELVAELEKRLFNLGFKVFIGNSMNNPQKEKEYLNELIANQVDGLIVGAHNRNISEYQMANLPIVAIDREINDDIPIIASDNFLGGKIATELLISRGSKNIIITDGPSVLKTPAHERKRAYESVMLAHHLIPHTFLINFDWSIEKKQSEIKKLFAEFPEMDGIFATNDIDAAMIWQTAKSLQIKVPQELKIIGYDGANTTNLLLPELTTIQQPIKKMAKIAVETLIARINEKPTKSKQIVPVTLWAGKSI